MEPERCLGLMPPFRFFLHPLVRTALLFWVSILIPEAQAQFTQQGPKLVGAGAIGLAEQGYAVAISGDGNTAIVGGPDDNSETGAAWVFSQIKCVWSHQGPKLVGTGA